MSPLDVDRLKTRIEAKLQALSGAVVSAKSDLRSRPETHSNVFVDELDFARAEADLQATVEVLNRNVVEGQLLLNAMARMSNGTFGRCLYCEDSVDSRRLNALPSAAFCVSCQEDLERGWIVVPSSRGKAA